MNEIAPHLIALSAPLLLCFMALIAALMWRGHPKHTYLLWLAVSQCFLALSLGIQTLVWAEHSIWTTACYLLSEACLAHAMARRLGQRLNVPIVATLCLMTLAGIWYFSQISPSLSGRLSVLSLGMGGILSHQLHALWLAPKRHQLDLIALVIYGIAALATLIRPLPLLGNAPYSEAVQVSMVWWCTLLGVLLLSIPYTLIMCSCAMVDAMHRLRQERDHDSLTGLLNRRAFEEACGPIPHHRGVCMVALCDLDHFKRLNDLHGHAAGDEVLRDFSAILRNQIGPTNTVARIGGEEFAIALHHVSHAQAKHCLQRIRQCMRQQTWSIPHLQVTASFGLVQALPNETLAQVLHRADLQLYAAKRAGRDRLHCESTVPDANCLPNVVYDLIDNN